MVVSSLSQHTYTFFLFLFICPSVHWAWSDVRELCPLLKLIPTAKNIAQLFIKLPTLFALLELVQMYFRNLTLLAPAVSIWLLCSF